MRGLLCYIVLALGICFPFAAQAQGWQWAVGTTGGSEGYGISVDPWGNVYSSGFSGSSLKLGGISLSGFGNSGAIVAKCDANGNFIWANSTHNGFAKPINIATDIVGNLYLLAYYTTSSILIDSVTLNNPGPGTELFLARFSTTGHLVWVQNICQGGPVGSIVVNGASITLSAVFNLPGINIGTTSFLNADPSGLTTDVAIAEYDTSGSLKSARTYGGTGNETGYVCVTPGGKIYLAGTSTSNSISFGSQTLINTDTSLYLVRFDSTYNAIWARNQVGIGKVGSGVGSIATDMTDNAYLCGSWRSAAYFGSWILPTDTASNIFLVKYDSAGSLSWLNTVTGNGQLAGYGVITDVCGNVWISGGMGDATPGHHGSGYVKIGNTKYYAPVGSRDPMLIAEWGATGNFIKAALLPTGGDDINSIGADGIGNIYVTGDYWLGPYQIAGCTLYDPKQPSEDLMIIKYLNQALDTVVNQYNICIADSVFLSAPPGYSFYRWDNGSMLLGRMVYAPGTYQLYATGNCSSVILKDIFTVVSGRLDTVFAHIDTSICRHAKAVLTGPAGYNLYVWSNGGTSRMDTISGPGIYWSMGIGNCTIPTMIDTFYVATNKIDLSFTLGNDTSLCVPMMLAGPNGMDSYLWQDGSTSKTDMAMIPGLYYLNVTRQSCFNSDSINVDFPDLTQNLPDTMLCMERIFMVRLIANVPPGSSVLWSTGSTQPSILVNDPGTYWVAVTKGECVGTDTMNMNTMECSCGAEFPKAFTPNGDGLNDMFHPIFDKQCVVFDYTFCIYNRWGNIVFNSHNPSEKWDGSYLGIPQDAGSFMYYLQYCTGVVQNKRTKKGDFQLIR